MRSSDAARNGGPGAIGRGAGRSEDGYRRSRRFLLPAVAAAAVLATAWAAAPAPVEAQTAMGLRVGNRWAHLETVQDHDDLSKVALGVYLGFGLTDNLAVQVELVYGSRGADGIGLGQEELDPAGTPVKLEMDYLEFPVLFRLGFPTDRVLPTLFAGAYIATLLDCEVTPRGDGLTAEQAESRKCDEETAPAWFNPRSTDFGVVAGGALDFSLGRNTLYLDVRYTVGIRSIEAGSDAMDARHRGLALSGGFAFPLGR